MVVSQDGGGESLRKIWIVVAGLLALGVTVALAVIGVTPQGGHTWLSIQNALSAVADHVKPTGGHTWL